MGAIPNRLPGFQDIQDDARPAARFEARLGHAASRRARLAPDRRCSRRWSAASCTALYVHRREPGPVRGRLRAHASTLLEGLDHLVVQDIFLTKTRRDGRRGASRRGRLVRGRGHGDQLRAAGAARPQGARRRPAARATTSRSSASSPAAWATTGAARRRRRSWDELRSLSPMHAGMSYARLEELGGIQWPCPDEEHPGPPFLHGRLWARAGRRRPLGAVLRGRARAPPVDELDRGVPAPADHRPAAGLLQHRRADRRLRLAAAPRRDARPVARGRRRGSGSGRRRDVRSSRAAARSRRRCASTPALRPGLAFMTMHFPDEVDVNILTIEATDPKSGTAEFKAAAIRVEKVARASNCRRDQQRGMAVAWTSGCSTPSRRRPSGPPSTPCSARRWRLGGGRRGRQRPRRARRPRGARPAPPAAAGPARASTSASAGSARAPQLHRRRLTCRRPRPTAWPRSTRCSRPSQRPPRVVHVCDDIACRCAGLPKRSSPSSSERSARRTATRGRRPTWLRSPCLGLCERAPAALRRRRPATRRVERALGHVRRRRHGARRCLDGGTPPTSHAAPVDAAAAARRRRACGCSRRVGVGRSREPRRLPRPRRLRRAAAGRCELGPERRDPRGHRLRPDGPRRRRLPDRAASGRRSRGQPGRPALPGLQRRRVRARARSRTGC